VAVSASKRHTSSKAPDGIGGGTDVTRQ